MLRVRWQSRIRQDEERHEMERGLVLRHGYLYDYRVQGAFSPQTAMQTVFVGSRVRRTQFGNDCDHPLHDADSLCICPELFAKPENARVDRVETLQP
jgi:hypothetical protein